jgi:membrane protease YdiL (CAAX protease family)
MAIVAVLLYFAGQTAAGVVVVFVDMVAFAMQGGQLDDPEVIEALTKDVLPWTILAGAFGGAAGLGLGALLVRKSLADPQPTGAAWLAGSPRAWLESAALGAAIASLVFLFALFVPPSEQVGPFAELATRPGAGQVIWLVFALLLAPLLEELLFRGLVLGGMAKSLGVRWAVVITTALFVLVHATEAIYYWPAFVLLGLLSLAACRQRLAHHAIGAAVATHFGYNLVVAGMTMLSS